MGNISMDKRKRFARGYHNSMQQYGAQLQVTGRGDDDKYVSLS